MIPLENHLLREECATCGEHALGSVDSVPYCTDHAAQAQNTLHERGLSSDEIERLTVAFTEAVSGASEIARRPRAGAATVLQNVLDEQGLSADEIARLAASFTEVPAAVEIAQRLDARIQARVAAATALLSPAEFDAHVQAILDDPDPEDPESGYYDAEAGHRSLDEIMERTLIALGYGDGVARIRASTRWYA